jgi:hypothetical protein
MRRSSTLLALLVLAFSFSLDAQRPKRPGEAEEPPRLPNGKSQQEEILKADHEKDVVDARELARLATELRDELEKSDAHVLSVASLKKTEDIEKLAKKIRGRIKRY